MRKKHPVGAFPLFAAVALGGCATVNPRPDYDRTAKHVEQATGQEKVYRPGDEAIVEKTVAALVDHGLTADEAVQVCLLNNPRLQAAFFNVGMARADVVQSGLLSNPSLGISLRLPSSGGLANVEAGLAQNIAELWQIPLRKRVAERALDQAILVLAREASLLAAEAKIAYYRAVAADRGYKITLENLEIVQQLVDVAIARQQAGEGTEIDITLSRSELRQTQLALRSARLAAFEQRSRLATLLGLTISPDRLVLLEDLPETPAWTLSPERLLEIAQTHRLDLEALRQAVETAAANLKLERLRVFSVVELGVGLERGERKRSRGRKFLSETVRSSAAAGAFALPEFERGSDEGTDLIIGPTLSLELPIFDQNQAQIAKAEYAYSQTAKVLESLNREITQETRLAHERARTAWDIARFYREQLLPLREANLELARNAYQAGQASFLVVLEAQRTLLAARAGYVRALDDSAVSLVAIEQVAGQPMKNILAPNEKTPPDSGQPTSDRSAATENG